MIYKNRPRPEHARLYTQFTTKLIQFPDHVTRMIAMNEFDWVVLNWKIDGEYLDLEQDILNDVLECAACYPEPERHVSDELRKTCDWYLDLRVQEWGPQTVDFVIDHFAA